MNNIEVLKAWKEHMYENAKERWPDLTRRQFGSAARVAIGRLPSEKASLIDVAKAIEAKLIENYGEGTPTAT